MSETTSPPTTPRRDGTSGVAAGTVANPWDIVIVGAGPAGLSAALILGRCCRRVLLCDRGTPRSWASKSMHAFTTRDGVPRPEEFRRLASRELRRYPNVAYWRGEVTDAARAGTGFIVRLGRRRVRARKLLIATGVLDQVPPVDGFAELFGISLFQCPYCDCQRAPKFPQLWELKIPHPVQLIASASSARTRPALSFSLSR